MTVVARNSARVCLALAAAALLVSTSTPPRSFAAEGSTLVLPPAGTIHGTLRRGEEDRYALTMAAGEYARLTIEQRGIDVAVQLRGPDGRAIAEFQDAVGPVAVEQVEVVATTAGSYTLALTTAPGGRAAGAYLITTSNHRPATLADRSLQEARTMRITAARLDADGRFDDARRVLERAMTLTQAVWGADDARIAPFVLQLAGVYGRLPDEPKSESLYERAIALLDRSVGAADPRTGFARSELAALYQRAGDRRQAEALLDEARAVIRRTLGEEHPWFVSCLATLANVRDDAKDLEEEGRLLQRALAIMERIGGTSTVQYATLLNALGDLHRQNQDYDGAEALLRRSLALEERLLGPDNYSVGTVLLSLGIVARERKEYARALQYYARALSIRERVVGSDHPDVAYLLTNVANIYRATGDYPRALETNLRALHIWERTAGPYHKATLVSLGNLARTYAAAGDLPNAIAFQRRAEAILEIQLALNLAVGSERQKLAFARGVSERTDRSISLSLDQAPGDAAAARLAATVVLQRKGRVLDAMVDTFATVRRRVADAGDRALLDQLRSTTMEVARIALDPREDGASTDRARSITELEARKEHLEAELSEHSSAFKVEVRPVTVESVQRAIPADAALIEYAVFRPFDPRAARNADAYGPPHYAAYVLRRHGAPRGVDLGDARAIDQHVAALREGLRDPRCVDLPMRARVVEDEVIRPLQGLLGTAARLLVSPDGDLNLIPFEALVDERGQYLIQRYAITYLTSGRDLLRMTRKPVRTGPAVVVANPLFGEPRPESVARPQMYFAPLGVTGTEASAIAALFPSARVLTGRLATKDALQRLNAPRVLHIASHGFFLPDSSPGRREGRGGPALPALETRVVPADVNPLVRSGLALAGANLAHGSSGEGILTALEASSLNLSGTKLVTLSACDTAVGEVKNGEGVYGLRRAFVLAGTETLVMSLWQVSDAVARETMVTYYTGLRAGLGRGDALRQAKLAMLRRKGRSHPYYWASFIQSGEWASLDGARPSSARTSARRVSARAAGSRHS